MRICCGTGATVLPRLPFESRGEAYYPRWIGDRRTCAAYTRPDQDNGDLSRMWRWSGRAAWRTTCPSPWRMTAEGFATTSAWRFGESRPGTATRTAPAPPPALRTQACLDIAMQRAGDDVEATACLRPIPQAE